MSPGPITAEEAVRQYLLYLDDPGAVRDEDAIHTAEAAVARATDPIEKLRAISALERARAVDGDAVKAAFVAHAKEWADAEGISAKSFLEIGVPGKVLLEAGISDPGGRVRRPSGSAYRNRAPRLSEREVMAKIPEGPFTIAELADLIERNTGTTTNYVRKLLSRGALVDLGDDPNHDGRGRAPKRYERS